MSAAQDEGAVRSQMRTLIADAPTSPRLHSLPPGYRQRSLSPDDIESLGSLYYAAYDPGVACATLEEAVEDMRATFQGAYGELWLAGSGGIEQAGALTAALLCVQRALWDNTPDCPFIIEIFTGRASRRRGLARALLSHCLACAGATERPSVALRVDAANDAALRLYASLGFRPWHPGL